jgi:lipopolysaccharide biosynthesis regulator YciM
MIEILFLLLPLAFYSGWKASKKNNVKQCVKANKLADDYVKGVNYLLSEKPDKALEVFIHHPDVDEYTVETYLLLGNMFRNRGEIERALRLHENLIARSSLNKDQKSAAMFALGEDYFAAGMLDRAEAVFQELLTTMPRDVNACASLRKIYEQTHEWEKAINVTRSICVKKKILPAIYQRRIAHYYCEIADQEMERGNLHRVEDCLVKAYKHYKDLSRVMVLQGNLFERKKNYKKAFKFYRKALASDSRLLSYLFPKITKVAERIGQRNEFEKVLFELYRQDSSVLAYLLKQLKVDLFTDKATGFLVDDLKNKKLDIYSISQSIDILQQQQQSFVENERLLLIKRALDHYLEDKAAFQCQNCGYQMQQYLWRCPACFHWDKISDA